MNGVIPTAKRGFHVLNPRGRGMDAPKGMIHFSNTPWEKTSQIQKSKKNLVLQWSSQFFVWGTILVFEHSIGYRRNLVLNAAFVWSVKKRCVVPLAVNLNHPFMESGSVSDSEVMVKFSESWIDPE